LEFVLHTQVEQIRHRASVVPAVEVAAVEHQRLLAELQLPPQVGGRVVFEGPEAVVPGGVGLGIGFETLLRQ